MGTTTEHISHLASLLNEFQFDDAIYYIGNHVEEADRMRTLHLLAEEKTGILVYTFITNALAKYPTSFWHRAGAMVLLESINKLPNSHRAAYYHFSQAAALSPNDWSIKEYVLHFYNEGFISQRVAKSFAEEILKHDAKNEMAKHILADMKTKKK